VRGRGSISVVEGGDADGCVLNIQFSGVKPVVGSIRQLLSG
jgi:hypothetical protein